MATKRIEISASKPNVIIERDDCNGETNEACKQDCLIKPRFFCGQLLTDQDLNALLSWSEDKFQLQRHKYGWGIACGLQVRCDASTPGGVKLMPGYAVDNCGQDIVVCEETHFDLSPACVKKTDPCAEFPGQEQPHEQPIAKVKSEVLGLKALREPPLVVEVRLHYKTEESQPVPALSRGVCSQKTDCEYSRTQEGHRLSWRKSSTSYDPVDKALFAWEKNYFKQTRKIVDDFLLAFPGGDYSDLNGIKSWLFQQLESQPLYEFCFIADMICRLEDSKPIKKSKEEVGSEYKHFIRKGLPAHLASILTLIVLDRRNEYLSRNCFTGAADEGIPLARVWLQSPESPQDACKVLRIENLHFGRQELPAERWPAPRGMLNVGQLIWRTNQEAHTLLRNYSMYWYQEQIDYPGTVEELAAGLDDEEENCRLFIDLDYNETLYVVLKCINDNQFNQSVSRVVSVCTNQDVYWDRFRKREELQKVELERRSEAVKRKAESGEAASKAAAEEKIVAEKIAAEKAKQAMRADVTPEMEAEIEEPLTVINGIGDERAFQLRQHKINTFEELAKVDMEILKELFPRVKESVMKGWQTQAKKFSRK